MEIRHLRYFLAVVDAGTFTRAAQQQFVAQSALSEQIARLETEVGARLFLRNSRSVTLTEAGRTLLPLARRVAHDVDLTVAEMGDLAGLQRGVLRLGLLQMPSSPIDVMQVIGTFHRKHPGIEFEISDAPSVSMAASLHRGELDAAVVGLAAADLPPGLSSIHLADEPLVAVVSTEHPLAQRRAVGFAELAGEGNFIHFARESGLRRCVDAAFARAGVPATGAFEMGRIIDMVRLAAHGVGVTVVPEPDVEEATAIAGIRFAVVPLEDPDALHPVRLAFDQDRSSRATEAFVAEFRNYLTIAAEERAATK